MFLRLRACFDLFDLQLDDLEEVRFVERFEDDDAVEAVDEFWLEVLFDRSVDLFFHRFVIEHPFLNAKAHFGRSADQISAEIGGHDDDRIAEVDLAAEGIGEASLFQNLEQQVHHIGMRFFDFVEKDDAIGALAHLLGELAAFFVSDIARRRSCHPADRKFLHVFGHVDLDEGIFAAEHIE